MLIASTHSQDCGRPKLISLVWNPELLIIVPFLELEKTSENIRSNPLIL